MPFPRFNLNRPRAQTVPVNLGPIRADLAYEESLINSGIASRAALIHQQVLEGQRLSLQNSRARQYTQAQEQAQREATRNELIRLRSELQTQLPEINLRATRAPRPLRHIEQGERGAPIAQGAQGPSNYITLARDRFGPILPMHDSEGIHPGHTNNHDEDLRFWSNQLEVENSRLLNLHSRNPILNNYANVRVGNLLETLENAGVRDEVAMQEFIIRHNIIESRDWIRTYRAIIEGREENQQPVRRPNLPTLTDTELTLEINIRQKFLEDHANYSEVCNLTGQTIEPIPDEFFCPITYDFMVNPVYERGVGFKRTYEKSAIYNAISQQLQDKPRDQPTDPFTRLPIYVDNLIPNTELINEMDAFKRNINDVINNYIRTNPNMRFQHYDALASGKKHKKRRKSKQIRQRQTRQRQTRQRQTIQVTIGKKSKKQYTKKHY